MNSKRSGVSRVLFGSKGHVGVSRGLAEFHGRRPVLIRAKNETLLALPVETLDTARLTAFMMLCAPRTPRLIVTARRALALGLDARTPMALRLFPDDDAASLEGLVRDETCDRIPEAKPAGPAAAAAIQLVKLSQGFPAVLAVEISDALPPQGDLITVDAEGV